MECYRGNCAICGIQTASELRIPENGTEILSAWKSQCAETLCNVLFESELRSVFLRYFENENYCSHCLQKIRDINFTWRQLEEFKRQMEKQMTGICVLLANNYKNRKNKTAFLLKQDYIPSPEGSCADNYPASKILEMIYTEILPKVPLKQENNLDDTFYDDRLLDYTVVVKEEHSRPEITDANDYDDYFDVGDENWQSENPFPDAVSKKIHGVPRKKIKRKKVKRKFSSRPKRRLRTLKRKANIVNECNNDTDSDMEENYAQSDDSDWQPSKKVCLSKNNGQCDLPSQKEESPEMFSDESDQSDNSPNYTSNEDSDNMTLFELAARKAMQRQITDLSCEEKPTSKRKRQALLESDIILDDSENLILKKLARLKFVKKFRLKQLEETELALVAKIAQYSLPSIRRLKLTAKERVTILELNRKIRDRSRTRNTGRIPKADRLLPCTEDNCSDKLKTKEELDAHVREKHKGEKLGFYCTTCPKQFKSYAKVKSHRKYWHQGLRLLYFHFCKICQKGYKTEEELKAHSETAHQGPNPFTCAFCNAERLTSLDLIRHMNESHSEVAEAKPEKNIQKLSCEICKQCFRTQKGLTRHLQKHQEEELQVNCDSCSRTFPSQKALVNHIGKKHTYIVCDACGKSITRGAFLKHQRVHNGELNFECTVCGKRYLTCDQLSNHERTHSGIRSFICSVCGKGFFTKVVLQGHEKIHEPGYIPRKPFRRTKPNRKKKIKEAVSECEFRNSPSSSSNLNNGPFLEHQNIFENNFCNIQQPQFLMSFDKSQIDATQLCGLTASLTNMPQFL